jgi:hypothetical protein
VLAQATRRTAGSRNILQERNHAWVLSGKIVAWAAAVMSSVFIEVKMTTQQLHGTRPDIITVVLDTPQPI